MNRLYVVDDDLVATYPLCRLLEHEGFHVAYFANGQDAIQHIISDAPDLVLLDLLMPQLDGCAMLEMIRSYERLESLAVIVMTGSSNSPMIERLRRWNVSDVLIKGEASFKTILSTVQRHCGNR